MHSYIKKELLSEFQSFYGSELTLIEKPMPELDSISNRIAGGKLNIFLCHLQTKDGKVYPIVCKVKSKKIIARGIVFLTRDTNLRLVLSFLRYHKIVSYDKSHLRESAIYCAIKPCLSRHLPQVYFTKMHPFRDRYLLCMAQFQDERPLEKSDFHTVFDAITSFHAAYYNSSSAVKTLGLNHYSARDYKKAKPLLKGMLDALDNTAFGEKTAQLYKFIGEIDSLYETLPLHKSLTHNDFSPRNIALYADKVLFYDWELACFQNPEHDLIELLLSLLHDMSSAEISHAVCCYRDTLFEKLGMPPLSDIEYKKIFRFNLLEFCVNKLSLLRLANRYLNQSFISQMTENAVRLLNWMENVWIDN